jgi:outer membrane protein assembly factor BamB
VNLSYNHRHGPGGSPVVYQNLLIIACDGTDVQYVTALDKQTGQEIWKSNRTEANSAAKAKMAYSTALVITVEGKAQVVSTGGEWAVAYEPLSGKEIWRFQYPAGYSNVPRPVYGEGLVFLCSGYDTPYLYAVKPNGVGDVTQTHSAWKMERGAPLNPSPLLTGGALYTVSDSGIASCLNAKTGEQFWQKRVGGSYSASPLLADGRLYLLDEGGTTHVIEPTTEEYRELAVNSLPGKSLASIAAADGALFLRTDAAVYRIQKDK